MVLGRRRSHPVAGVVVGLLVATAVTALPGVDVTGASGGDPFPVPTLPAGTIVHSEFARSFSLGRGALTVSPAAGLVVTRSEPSVAAQIQATEQAAGLIPDSLGFGSVSLRVRVPGLPPISALSAWVGLVVEGVYSCPFLPTSTPAPPKLPSNGWSAVVVGDAPGSPAFVYTAAAYRCDHLVPASVHLATEAVSVPWRTDGPEAAVRIPYCGSFASEVGGYESGDAVTRVAEYANVAEDPTAVNRTGRCQPAETVVVATNALTSSRHAALGPVRLTSGSFHLGAHPLLFTDPFPPTLPMSRGPTMSNAVPHLPWGTAIPADQDRWITLTSGTGSTEWGVWKRSGGPPEFPVRSVDGGRQWEAAGPLLATDWAGGGIFYVTRVISYGAAAVALVSNAVIDVTSDAGHHWFQYVNYGDVWSMSRASVPGGVPGIRVRGAAYSDIPSSDYATYRLDAARHRWVRVSQSLTVTGSTS